MRTVWQRLLDRLAAGELTICGDEVRRWDKKQWQEILGLGLLREIELAESVLCDQCGNAHWAGIFWVTPGVKACFGCDTEGVIEIEIDRLRQWRIDADRIAGLVAESLELRRGIQPLELGRLWHIGRRRLAGRFRDVFLTLADAGTVVGSIERVLKYGGLVSGVVILPRLGDVGSIPSQITVVDLAAISQIVQGILIVDFDYLEGSFPETADAYTQNIRSITAASGASWKDVSMAMSEGFLQITLGGKQSERSLLEAGFGDPDQRADLLRLFAAARGTITVEKMGPLLTGASPAKTRVLRLRQLLQAMIEIDGDPIEYSRKAGTYSCQFEIRLAGDHGFRTPAGATWLDFTFHERPDGRVAVSVSEKQRFRAYGTKDDAGRSTGEVGEDGQAITRIHSLEEMGLRGQRGQLTAEGTVFVKLLRGGGAIPSAGNEMVVIKLAERLREWAGIPGDPIQLAKASRRWTAVFACSSTTGVTRNAPEGILAPRATRLMVRSKMLNLKD